LILNLDQDLSIHKKQITKILNKNVDPAQIFPKNGRSLLKSSAVFLLMGTKYNKEKSESELCVILNKRSPAVRQPGDICCPGGGISTPLDPVIAKFLTLPAFPMARWKHWNKWRMQHPREARKLAVVFAACLRESFEEMSLNPFGVQLLGPLPMEYLSLSDKMLYPIVGWVLKQREFIPNWEVDKILYIPVKDLLNYENYGKFTIQLLPNIRKNTEKNRYYQCFICQDQNGKELLWGATYRIVIRFMKTVFGFKPPENESLQLINAQFYKTYPEAFIE